jgi:hypothetical protein
MKWPKSCYPIETEWQSSKTKWQSSSYPIEMEWSNSKPTRQQLSARVERLEEVILWIWTTFLKEPLVFLSFSLEIFNKMGQIKQQMNMNSQNKAFSSSSSLAVNHQILQ